MDNRLLTLAAFMSTMDEVSSVLIDEFEGKLYVAGIGVTEDGVYSASAIIGPDASVRMYASTMNMDEDKISGGEGGLEDILTILGNSSLDEWVKELADLGVDPAVYLGDVLVSNKEAVENWLKFNL